MAARLKARSNSGKSPEPASLRLLEQHLFHGRPAEAERLARVLVGRYPADGRVWKALGAALDQLNRLPESVAAMTRAAQVLPSDAEVFRILAVCLIKAGRIAEAEIPLRAALVLDINSAPLYCYLGATLLSQERFAESEEASRKALELDPTLNAARSNRGIALVRLGRWSEGEALCRLATEIDPHFAEAHINLGSALEMLGRCVERGCAGVERSISIPMPATPTAHGFSVSATTLRFLRRPYLPSICISVSALKSRFFRPGGNMVTSSTRIARSTSDSSPGTFMNTR
jgi:Flp pilus assembly protein TadD